MGGVPVFFSILVSILIWMNQESLDQEKYFIVALIIIFIIGLRDDLIPMKPIYKIINQLIPAVIVVVFSNIEITSFYEIFSQYTFPRYFTLATTLLTIIVITNSYNLIDGIDGLVGSVGVLTIGLFGFWFYLVGNISLGLLCFSFVGGLLAFLFYNWQPSKIFMGDTGALLIGFFVACIVIIFFNTNQTISDSAELKFRNPISIAIAVLIIPLFDTLRVFVIRLMNNRSPFSPDNNHMHHKLLKYGLSHGQAVLFLLFVNFLFLVVVILLKDRHEFYSFGSIVLMSIITTIVLSDKIFPQRKGVQLPSKPQTKKPTIK